MASDISLENLNEINEIENSIKNEEMIRERIIELLSGSTAHGIPNIVKTKHLIIKIVWLVFFIISTGFGSYYVIDSVLDYLKFQTITSTKVIREKQSQFPTVSFCGSPAFDDFSLDQIVMSTRFEGVYESNISKVFEEFKDTVWNKCFKFNSGKDIYGNKIEIVNTTLYGKPNNLIIGFNLKGQDDFREILIKIHNHSSHPIDLENGGYWLKTGSINYFEVKRVFTRKLSAPFSDCLEDVESFGQNKTIIDHMKNLEKSYSQDECFRMCSHLYALEESNCSCNTTFENFENDCLTHPINSGFNAQVKNCVADYLKKFRKTFLFEKCQQFCPEECFSISYVINNYNEQFPISGSLSSKRLHSIDLKAFSSYEDLHKHYIRLYVYYIDLKYALISENAKTEPYDFFSNIGGTLSLFLGISFLSFIEILEIIYEIICFLTKKQIIYFF